MEYPRCNSPDNRKKVRQDVNKVTFVSTIFVLFPAQKNGVLCEASTSSRKVEVNTFAVEIRVECRANSTGIKFGIRRSAARIIQTVLKPSPIKSGYVSRTVTSSGEKFYT
jgi:hypothetical protein